MFLRTVLIVFLIKNVACSFCPGKAPVLRLNDGWIMPTFGLGTWLGIEKNYTFAPVRDDSVQIAVEQAIDDGYRLIDTAAIYKTEPLVGKAIQNKIDDGVIQRGDVFISTKLWNDQHAKGKVIDALKTSLKDLNMDYVDLYLIHFPIGTHSNNTPDDTDFLDTWKAMIEARKLGLTRSIGVSNFNAKQIDRLVQETGVVPAVLQIEVHLNLQQPELIKSCREHGITVMGYTPFGAIFGKAGPEAPPPRADDPDLVAIAKKHNKTVAQIVLRYIFEQGVVAIPKTVKASRIKENIDIFDFKLSPSEKETLRKFDKNYIRLTDFPPWRNSPFYPF